MITGTGGVVKGDGPHPTSDKPRPPSPKGKAKKLRLSLWESCRLSKNIHSLLFETKAAFARRKRRKGAGGNLKTEIPPGPPLNLFDQITRLHSPAALVAEDFSIFCMLQKKSSAKSPHSVLLQAFSAAATMNSYFFDKLRLSLWESCPRMRTERVFTNMWSDEADAPAPLHPSPGCAIIPYWCDMRQS